MSEHCGLRLCDNLDRRCGACEFYIKDNPAAVKARKEREAKKRLEKAAPALLEACKWIEDVLAGNYGGGPWCALREIPGAKEWADGLHAAIKAAT